MMYLQDKLDPIRARSASDMLIFPIAMNQRQAIVFIHFYNLADAKIHMALLQQFYFGPAGGFQRCRDFIDNVPDRMVDVQEPTIRYMMERLYAMTFTSKSVRSASSIVEESDVDMEGSRAAKTLRIGVGAVSVQPALT